MQKGNIRVQTENIFPIIKKFLYSDHEIFLRELVSNAVDATHKLKTLASGGEAKGEDELPVADHERRHFNRDAVLLGGKRHALLDRRLDLLSAENHELLRFGLQRACEAEKQDDVANGFHRFWLTLQMSHDPAWHQRLLRSRRAKQGRWL